MAKIEAFRSGAAAATPPPPPLLFLPTNGSRRKRAFRHLVLLASPLLLLGRARAFWAPRGSGAPEGSRVVIAGVDQATHMFLETVFLFVPPWQLPSQFPPFGVFVDVSHGT